MPSVQPGLYTIHWARSPNMVLSVAHDYDDSATRVWAFHEEYPSDGQIWRLVADTQRESYVLFNVMSGKALALPNKDALAADLSRQWDADQKAAKEAFDKAERTKRALDEDYKTQTYIEPDKPDFASTVTYSNGYDVMQFDYVPGSELFRWTIASAGREPVQHNGSTYQTFYIYTDSSAWSGTRRGVISAWHSPVPDCDRVGMWDIADLLGSWGPEYAEFFFEPLLSGVPEGTYQIATTAGTILGLTTATKDNGARIRQVADTDAADAPLTTVWQLKHERDASGPTGLSTLRLLASGSYLATAQSVAQAEGEVVQWDSADGPWGKWLVNNLDYGKDMREFPCWIRPQSGVQLVLAAGTNNLGSQYVLTENIEEVTASGKTDSYVLFLRAVDALVATDVATPSDVQAATEQGGVPTTSVVAPPDGHVVLWPTWRYATKNVKVRWRITGSSAEDATVSVVGAGVKASGSVWHDLNGSSSYGGMGDKGGSGTEAVLAGGRCWSARPIKFDVPAGSDKVYTVEIAVRGVEADYGGTGLVATGPEVTGYVTVYPAITASVSGCTWSPDGLRIGYSLSGGGSSGLFVRLDSLDVGGRECLVSPVALMECPRSGVLLVPMSSLAFVPVDGGAARGTLAAGRLFGGESPSTFSARVEYQAFHGVSVSPILTCFDGPLSVWVRLGNHDSASVWYQVATDDGERYVRAEDIGDGTFECYPPLGARCRLYVVVTDGDAWGTSVGWLPPLAGDGREWELFNWPGGHCRLRLNLSESLTYRRGYETVAPEGLDYEMTVFTGGASQAIQVSGAVALDASLGHDGFADYEALLRCGHAVWRSPYGRLARVAVVGGSAPRARTGWGDVTVDLRREDV